MTRVLKVSSAYKWLNAAGFLLVYLVVFGLEVYVNGFSEGSVSFLVGYTVFALLLFYTTVGRASIKYDTDADSLVCKPANKLFTRRVKIDSISKVQTAGKFGYQAVRIWHGEGEKTVLHPENAEALRELVARDAAEKRGE